MINEWKYETFAGVDIANKEVNMINYKELIIDQIYEREAYKKTFNTKFPMPIEIVLFEKMLPIVLIFDAVSIYCL